MVSFDEWKWMNTFKVVYQWFIAMYDTDCQILCNRSKINPGFKVSINAPMNHAADKHDTPPSHFIQTLCQSALL